MTKLPAYPEYKDAGVDWLGRVPSHWSIRPLGACFDERRETVSDKEFRPLSVTMKGIVPQLETAAKTDNGENRKRVNVGDFVINSRSDRKGSAGVSALEGSVSVISTVLAPRDVFSPAFIHYLLRSQPFQEEYYRFGTGIVADLWSTRYSGMKRITLALPSLAEQSKIVKFLDRETVEMEKLSKKQKRLVELLGEKRQAIITHAVSAPVGVSTLSKLRYQATLNPPVPPALKAQQDAQRAFLPMNAVGERGEIDLSLTRAVGEVLGGYSYFQDGDVSFAKVTPCFENGKGAVFRGLRSGEGFGTTELTVLRCRPSLIPDYLYLLTQSDLFRKNGVAAMTGAGGLKRVPDEFVRNFEFYLPDLETQASIVATVRRRLETIDELVGRAQRAVRLLAERHTALIAATVTGKIDVQEGAS